MAWSSLIRLSLLCCTLAASPAGAAAPPPDPGQISQGMSYQEVIALWGAPLDKYERESRREDIWLYPTIAVRFREGKTIAARYRSSAPAPKPAPSPSEEELLEQQLEPAPPDDRKTAVQDILSDIIDSGGEKQPSAPEPERGPAVIER